MSPADDTSCCSRNTDLSEDNRGWIPAWNAMEENLQEENRLSSISIKYLCVVPRWPGDVDLGVVRYPHYVSRWCPLGGLCQEKREAEMKPWRNLLTFRERDVREDPLKETRKKDRHTTDYSSQDHKWKSANRVRDIKEDKALSTGKLNSVQGDSIIQQKKKEQNSHYVQGFVHSSRVWRPEGEGEKDHACR